MESGEKECNFKEKNQPSVWLTIDLEIEITCTTLPVNAPRRSSSLMLGPGEQGAKQGLAAAPE
ncbi:hypothetical protein VTK26DRAFT_780 [Humicola hyalothermophila]